MELETHDLATLPDLNEEILLEYLKARYKYDMIYVNSVLIRTAYIISLNKNLFLKTYIGDILLAINPFKTLPIYDQKVLKF